MKNILTIVIFSVGMYFTLIHPRYVIRQEIKSLNDGKRFAVITFVDEENVVGQYFGNEAVFEMWYDYPPSNFRKYSDSVKQIEYAYAENWIEKGMKANVPGNFNE